MLNSSSVNTNNTHFPAIFKTYKIFHLTQLQMQQHRLIKLNQDLRHRMALMEAQGKTLIQQKVELQAAAQAQQQDLQALQLEAGRLRKEIQSLELDQVLAKIAETTLVTSETSAMEVPPTLSRQESSLWAECGADTVEQDEDICFLPRPSIENRNSDDEKSREMFLVKLLLSL